MYFVDTIEVPGLGNRSYLAGGPGGAVAVDPPRDVDRMIAAAARRGVRIAYVVETHIHNDYVTGGPELARLTGAAHLVPAALGGALAAELPPTVLTGSFALVAGVAAYRMLRPSGTRRAESTVRPSRVALSGAGLGGVTGVLGVGGGFLAVPALVSVVGLRMRDAVGTSLLVITVNSFAALAGRTGAAEGLDWAVVAPFAGAAVLGAWDGRRLAAKVSGDTLRRIFAWVLLAVAAFMLIDAITWPG